MVCVLIHAKDEKLYFNLNIKCLTAMFLIVYFLISLFINLAVVMVYVSFHAI